MTRFEDLPPVDGEGWLADQGRNFLQQTDARISRLRLPNFMADTQKKIQGLGSDLGQMYQGLEQGLSSLPSQAQQASTNFLTSTTGRISGLGSQLGGLGQSVGQGFSDLGSGIRGSADDLTELLERQREEAEERRRAQEEDARRRRDQLVQGVGDRASRLGTGLSGVRDRAGEAVGGLNEGLQTRLTGVREADAQDLGAGLERLRGFGREQEATQRRSDVGFSEAMNRAAARGGYEDVITPEETKWFREAGENLAGAGPTGNTPNVVDDAVAFLLRQGFRGGRAVVERFVRTVGEPTVRRAMQQGEALGALFDDYLARAAERVPGGRAGPAGRLMLDETGSGGVPRLPGPSGRAPRPGDYDAAQRAIDDLETQLNARYGEQAVLDAPTHPELFRDAGIPVPDSPIPAPELARLQELHRLRDAIGAGEDVAELGTTVGQLSPQSLSGPAPREAVEQALREVQANRNLSRATGSGAGGTNLERVARDLYVRLSHALAQKGQFPRELAGDFEAALNLAQPGEFERSIYGMSPEPLLRQVRDILRDVSGQDLGPAFGMGPPGGLGGVGRGLQRLLTEETGALRLPRFGRAAPPDTAVRPQAPPLSSVSDTQTVAETLDTILASQADVASGRAGRAGQVPAAAGEIERALTDTRSKVYGAWFDQGDSLRRVQSLIERDLGRPLSEAEDAYLHFRLLAGRGDAAAQDIKDNLLPALRGLSKEDESLLNGFLQAADNADKAAAVGGRVELDALGRPLGKVAGEADLRSAKASLAGRERVLQGARTTADAAEQTYLRAEAAYRTAAQGARGRSKAAKAQLPQLRSARDRARAARDAARQSLRDAEGALERSDVRAGRAAERGERAEAKVEAGQAAAESTQMEGAAEAGAQAAAARRFSGGVIAQPLEEVKAEFVARYGPERAQKLFDAAEGVWGFTRALRKRLRDSGGLPEDVYQSWEQQFPHYVHSDILDFLPDVNGVGGRVTPGGPLLSVADLGLHRQSVEGTTRARDLPLNSVIKQAFSVEGLARRNEGANALLTLREQSPELQRLLRPHEEGVPLRSDEAILSAFVDGVQQRFVGPKMVVEGLSRFEGEARNSIIDAAATMTGAPLLRETATGASALFIPVNAIRDAWTYLIRTGAAADPRKFGRSLGTFGKAYWDSFAKGQSDPDLAEFLRAGGGQAHELFNQTPEEILRGLQRGERGGALGPVRARVRPVTTREGFMRAVGDVAGAGWDVARLPLAPVKAFGSAVERGPRLAQYRLARREGQSPRRAALAARDITMDFSRGGTFSKVANRILPFFNVGLQSPERLLTQDLAKGKRLQTGIGLTTSVLLPALVAEAWNRSQAPEDYADVPDYLKDTGLVVMSPVAAPDNPDGTPGERPYLWLPMPQQYAFLKVVATQAVAQAVGDDRRGWGDVLGTLTGSLSPLGEDASVGVLPPFLRTAVEVGANKDFFRGRPIVSEQYQNLPPEQQATPSTSALSRAVGGVLGQTPLGLGPAKVEHAIRSTTGGVGKQVLGATDAVARAFGLPASQERPPGVVDLPVVGGLAGTVLRNQGGQTQRDAYRTLDAAKERETREQLAAVHEDPAYQAMSPTERAAVDRRIADRVERRYDNRYQAIARGRATEVLELQRELAGR